MNGQALCGVIPILPTPFRADGQVDEDSFRRVVDASLRDGVHGLALFGLASEYYKLSDAEKESLAAVLLRQVGGKIPVIVSITSHATELATREAKSLVDAGADALMIMPPHFLSPNAAAIREHIGAIVSEISVPVVIQYAPAQTGRELSAEFFACLNEQYPNVTHVKVDLASAGPLISSLNEASKGRLKSLVGYMGLRYPSDSGRGACGVMPTCSFASAYLQLFRLLREDPAQAYKLHTRLLPLLNFMMQSVEILIAVEKQLLMRRGIISDPRCRRPCCSLDLKQIEDLECCASELSEYLQPSAAES